MHHLSDAYLYIKEQPRQGLCWGCGGLQVLYDWGRGLVAWTPGRNQEQHIIDIGVSITIAIAFVILLIGGQ